MGTRERYGRLSGLRVTARIPRLVAGLSSFILAAGVLIEPSRAQSHQRLGPARISPLVLSGAEDAFGGPTLLDLPLEVGRHGRWTWLRESMRLTGSGLGVVLSRRGRAAPLALCDPECETGLRVLDAAARAADGGDDHAGAPDLGRPERIFGATFASAIVTSVMLVMVRHPRLLLGDDPGPGFQFRAQVVTNGLLVGVRGVF